jgi:tRNA(Ile)-lysidine synthase
VTFGPEVVAERLDALETADNKPDRYVIALSGGLDSTVLAHALTVTRERHGKSLLAVHVDHQLHPESGHWNDYCRRLADTLDLEFVAETVSVVADGGGLEAAARKARYAALARHTGDRDWLLSAHHRNDQAETLLLNLMRGSGPAGMAGIGLLTPFAAGWLVRPLIDVPRDALEAYAAAQNLHWVDDPSNEDLRFDRNYLRHEVLPPLEQRWPGVIERLARSADLAAEAAMMLDELAASDLREVGDRAARIDIAGLLQLTDARQRNLLRHAIRREGLPLPGAARLATVLVSVLQARDDAQPMRGKLYLSRPLGEQSWPPGGRPLADSPVSLGPGMGTLRLAPGAPRGLSGAVLAGGLAIRMRKGGEEINRSDTYKETQETASRKRHRSVDAGTPAADLLRRGTCSRSRPVGRGGGGKRAVCWDDRPELH